MWQQTYNSPMLVVSSLRKQKQLKKGAIHTAFEGYHHDVSNKTGSRDREQRDNRNLSLRAVAGQGISRYWNRLETEQVEQRGRCPHKED